jgi:hypothetical protein
LPITNYLDRNNVKLVYPNGYPRNIFLEDLNNKKELIYKRGIKVTNIVGLIADRTVDHFSLQDVTMGRYWFDGMPLNYYTTGSGIFRDLGDNTVTLDSQTGLLGDVISLPGIAHTDLPRKSIEKIMDILTINHLPVETVDVVNKYLLIGAHSPVDFYVLDPDGKRIGYNKDGVVFNEIDRAFYTGNNSDTEFLTIPNPRAGEYRVVTYGTDTGSYEIEATYTDDENNSSITSSYMGQTTLGKEDSLLIELSPDSGTIETTIDDKTAPVTTATIEGNLVGEYYNTNAKVTLLATDDESGVQKTEYSLDGIVWQDYAKPVALSQNGEITVNYRSIDQTGNEENIQSLTIKIDRTAPIVTINLNKEILTHWDHLDIRCDAADNYSGMNSLIVRLDGVVLDCGKSVNLFDQTIGTHTVEYVAIDKAGNVTSGEKTYQVVANYGSTLRDIYWLYDSKHFKRRGEAISVAVHVELSWLFDTIGINRKATASLEQAQSLLEKQFAKDKITRYGYDMIIRDIKYILEGK